METAKENGGEEGIPRQVVCNPLIPRFPKFAPGTFVGTFFVSPDAGDVQAFMA